MSTGEINRKALAKAMREFTIDKLNLTLVRDEAEAPNADKFPTLYAPKWLRVLTGTLTAIVFIGFFFAFGGKHTYDTEPDSEPFRWIYFNRPIAFFIWGAFVTALAIFGSMEYRFTQRRWAMLASINKLKPIKYGKPLMPGSQTKNATGYINAFRAPEPLDAVSFGVVSGWWDPNTKPKYNPGRSGTLKSQLFARVELPELNGETIIVNKNREWTRAELPAMSDHAYKAISTLASYYSVVIGEGQLLIALAGNTNNSFAMSLDGDLDSMMGWKICIDFINNELADIVEGLSI